MATVIKPTAEVIGTVHTNRYLGESNTISTATNSNVVIIPKLGGKGRVSGITCHLVLTGDAVAKVQVTNGSQAQIEADTNTWADWDINGIGEDPIVNYSLMVELTPAITGLRVVISSVTTGTAKIIVRFDIQV